MSDRWFTSDTHFFHRGAMEFCPASRGHFADVDQMNETMISIWNSVVKPEDTIYVIGDFSFGKLEETCDLTTRLQGKKHLIAGNHDRKMIRYAEFCVLWDSVSWYETLQTQSELITMHHFPQYEWEKMHHGAIHLHGHVHGKKLPILGKIIDVGVDTNVLHPYHYDEIHEIARKLPIREH